MYCAIKRARKGGQQGRPEALGSITLLPGKLARASDALETVAGTLLIDSFNDVEASCSATKPKLKGAVSDTEAGAIVAGTSVAQKLKS